MSHNPSTAAPNRFPVSIIPTPHRFGNKSNGRVAYNKCGRPMDKMRYSRGCRTWSFGVTGKPTSIRWTRIDLELSYAQVFCLGGDSVLEVDAEIATSTPNETKGGIPIGDFEFLPIGTSKRTHRKYYRQHLQSGNRDESNVTAMQTTKLARAVRRRAVRISRLLRQHAATERDANVCYAALAGIEDAIRAVDADLRADAAGQRRCRRGLPRHFRVAQIVPHDSAN